VNIFSLDFCICFVGWWPPFVKIREIVFCRAAGIRPQTISRPTEAPKRQIKDFPRGRSSRGDTPASPSAQNKEKQRAAHGGQGGAAIPDVKTCGIAVIRSRSAYLSFEQNKEKFSLKIKRTAVKSHASKINAQSSSEAHEAKCQK
jgi:hypothetical protein